MEEFCLTTFVPEKICVHLQLRFFSLYFVTTFLMDISEPQAMTRTVSKLFTVEHQPCFVYYDTSASNEPYLNIQATIHSCATINYCAT